MPDEERLQCVVHFSPGVISTFLMNVLLFLCYLIQARSGRGYTFCARALLRTTSTATKATAAKHAS
jgi:hypothetical protein